MKPAKAHAEVHRAVLDGRLVRQPCEVCGSEDVVGHHDDYDKPLDVRWLCRLHHRQYHSEHPTGLEWGSQLGPILLSAELLEQLKELAKLNERTVAGEARLALRNHVERNLHSKRAPAEAGQ